MTGKNLKHFEEITASLTEEKKREVVDYLQVACNSIRRAEKVLGDKILNQGIPLFELGNDLFSQVRNVQNCFEGERPIG